MNRTILHVDMNSYFATVEQQANPHLRGKPIAVRGSANERTIIVASSIEAKKLGIKTGMMIHEALRECPELQIVIGEPRKYSSITRKFIEILDRYADKVEIFSIDEAFLDITGTIHLFKNAREVAYLIKNDIRQEIGQWITCSIGISHNKFLAKLGSNLEKPDGLIEISENDQIPILDSCKLTDLCGIAHRIEQRLNILSIHSVRELREADPLILFKKFGSYGMKLYRMSRGIDNSPVSCWKQQPDAKSFGHSRTLNRDITSVSEIKKHIYLLSERVAIRMRQEHFWGREVFLWLRLKDFTILSKKQKGAYWICEEFDIYEKALKILTQFSIRSPVRAIGVGVTDIASEKNISSTFLEEDKIKEKIILASDAVNNKFGSATLTRGTISGMRLKEIVSGMGRKKF